MAARAPVAATGTLIDTLPRRLRNFFARYPPDIYSAAAIPKPQPPPGVAPLTPAPSPYTPNRNRSDRAAAAAGGSGTAATANTASSSDSGSNSNSNKPWSPSAALLRSSADPNHSNPFLPFRNPASGRWRGAVVGLRRQAELVKIAAAHGVEELLPPGPKASEYKAMRAEEKGLRVRGTGVGQRVKGHRWERTMAERLEKRRTAMLEMPVLIRAWKQVCLCLPLSAWWCWRNMVANGCSVVTAVDGRSTRRNKKKGFVYDITIILHTNNKPIYMCNLLSSFLCT